MRSFSHFFNLSILLACAQPATGGIVYRQNAVTGGVESVVVEGDTTSMDWLVRTDGLQYTFVTAQYAWGLGYLTETDTRRSRTFRWEKPQTVRSHADAPDTIIYQAGDVQVCVRRATVNGEVVESYTFTNTSAGWLTLQDVGIYTPFNDNYPDAATCVARRCNTHIWARGEAAWVYAERMGGMAPHVALMLTEGELDGYDIWLRGLEYANSQTRGIIALRLPTLYLRGGESRTISWRLFAIGGEKALKARLVAHKGYVEADRYVLQQGETTQVRLVRDNGTISRTVTGAVPGETVVSFADAGVKASADLWVVGSIDSLIDCRAGFIVGHQQVNDPDDPRCGAFMVYDCEGDSIYPDDTPNSSPVDRDEGAERVGMGVFLAEHVLARECEGRRGKGEERRVKNEEWGGKDGESLLRYARFLRTKLQDADYKTFSSVDKRGRNRAYNYPWVARFYFLMYRITGDRLYAADGYGTLCAMFRQFGHAFYAIDIPVVLGLRCLDEAGMTAERDTLLRHFRQQGDEYVRIGLNYPKFEVNYEQSIVAPAVEMLAQLYLVTHDRRYLDEARRQMPVVEAFGGFQPSYHLHDIAIRHWDGYWFGKREMFGDTFPHYWSCVTASAFHYYALCTGDSTYQRRAEGIVRQNLCLFMGDGKASCAYLFPTRVNGVPARFYDPYANDQDWALAYYYQVCGGASGTTLR